MQMRYDDLYLNQIDCPEAAALIPQEAVDELAARLKVHGITGFLVVRMKEDGRFGLVSGLILYRAAKAAGLSKVPCLVLTLPEDEALAEHLREIIRRGRRDFEEALAYRIGMERFGWTVRWLQDEFGRSEGHISEKLGLVALYEYVPELLLAREQGQLSDRAVIALRQVFRSQAPEAEQVARVCLLAQRLLEERWPAAVAADMVRACLRALDQGLPMPPAPERGAGAKGLLKAEIAELERRRRALLVEVAELQEFARTLSPFWAEGHRILADIQGFAGRLSEIKPPPRRGDLSPESEPE